MSDLFQNVTVFHGDEKSKANKPESAMDIVAAGGALEQVKTQYLTAVRVQKPRDLDKIVSTLMAEADYAGDDWYYSWSVNNKATGRKEMIEGASIGAAYAIMREWGNCAVDTEYEERGDNDIFTAKFIDVEKGVTQTRIFRQRKKAAVGKYDSSRYDDMQFQLAQSKAIRNVILAGVPRWLADACVAKAKNATVNMIEKLGLHAARQQCVDFFAPYDVDVDQIERLLQKKKDKWTTEDMAQLRGLAKNIKDGQVDPQEAFPSKKDDTQPPQDVTAKRARKSKETPQSASSEQESDPKPATTRIKDEPDELIDCPNGDKMKAGYCQTQCASRENCPSWPEREPGSDDA